MSGTADLKEVNITRLFNAPRAVVYKAWTTPELLAKWWGPEGYTNPKCDLELREGGKIHIDMQAPDGTIHPMDGTFHDIIEPSMLVFTTTAFKNDEGKPQLENINTVTLIEENNITRLNLYCVVIRADNQAKEAIQNMEDSLQQSFDRLARILENNQ